MFVSPISQLSNRSNYNTSAVKKANKVDSPVAQDTVSFKAIPVKDFSAVKDPYIRRYVQVYVRNYDAEPLMRNYVQAKFAGMRDILNGFPDSDRMEFYDVINTTTDISNVLERVRKGMDSFSKRAANASRREAVLPILVHNNEVIASIHNNGTYGSDNGGNWRSAFDFNTEDFQIIFHRPSTPDFPDGHKISYQAFSKDVDGDLMYTKAPNFEYTFYNSFSADGLKRKYEKGIYSLDGHTSELREYDKKRNLLNPDYLPRKIKKWLGF